MRFSVAARIGGDVRFRMLIRRSHPTPAEKKKICLAAREGHTIAHLSQVFHYHRNSISQWIKKDQQGSDFARKTSPGSGRISKIDCVIGRRLLRILKQPASKYGFENDCWTTPRIRVVCKKHLGVMVSRMSVFRTLKRYEYAYKTPPEAVLRNERCGTKAVAQRRSSCDQKAGQGQEGYSVFYG